MQAQTKMLMRQIFTLEVNVFVSECNIYIYMLFSFDACIVMIHERQVDMLNGLEYSC